MKNVCLEILNKNLKIIGFAFLVQKICTAWMWMKCAEFAPLNPLSTALMEDMIYIQRLVIGDLMKIAPILFNVLWKKLVLEEEMHVIYLLLFTKVSVQKVIAALFAVFAMLNMERLMKTNVKNAIVLHNLDTSY